MSRTEVSLAFYISLEFIPKILILLKYMGLSLTYYLYFQIGPHQFGGHKSRTFLTFT